MRLWLIAVLCTTFAHANTVSDHSAKLGRVVLLKPTGGQSAGCVDVFEKNLDTGSTKLLISHKSFPKEFVWPVEAVKPSPSGRYLALIESVAFDFDAKRGEPVFTDGVRCWIWERKTGHIVKVSDDQLGSQGFDWLPKGNRLLIHDDAGGFPSDEPYEGSIAFYDAATKKLDRLGSIKRLLLTVPSGRGDGAIEVIMKGDKSYVYFQPVAGRHKLLFRWSGPIVSLAQSPDGSYFAFYDLDNYHITDARGRSARRFKIPGVNVNFAATFKFNPGGTSVAVFTEYSTGEPHVNNTQQLWLADVRSGRARRIAKWDELFQGPDLAIARAVEGWLPDDRSVVISGDLYYGAEKPADTEHDWYKLWAYDTNRGNGKARQIFDSGKGWYGAGWWYEGVTR